MRRKKGKKEEGEERKNEWKTEISSLSNNIFLNTINGMFPHKLSTVNTLHGLPMGFLKNSPPIFCVAMSSGAVSDRDGLSHCNGFLQVKIAPSCDMSQTWSLSQSTPD